MWEKFKKKKSKFTILLIFFIFELAQPLQFSRQPLPALAATLSELQISRQISRIQSRLRLWCSWWCVQLPIWTILLSVSNRLHVWLSVFVYPAAYTASWDFKKSRLHVWLSVFVDSRAGLDCLSSCLYGFLGFKKSIWLSTYILSGCQLIFYLLSTYILSVVYLYSICCLLIFCLVVYLYSVWLSTLSNVILSGCLLCLLIFCLVVYLYSIWLCRSSVWVSRYSVKVH